MFIIYDLNFREVSLPKDNFGLGLEGLDLFFSSIGRNVSDEHRTHVSDGPRSANIRAYIKSMSRQDYKLKRNRVYSFFRQLGDFYVADIDEPNKLLKVSVDTEFTPNWLDGVNHAAEMDIPLSIVGQPYRISRQTTLDIHNDGGLIADGDWSADMGLTAQNDKQYVFNNQTDIEVYNPSDIDLYIKQHLDFKIKFECLQSMSRISLLDANSKEFIFTDALKTGDVVEIEGHRIKKNGQLAAAKFNDVYPTLKGGYSEVYQEYSMNKIKVSPGLKVTFDFRAKYD